MESYKQRQKTDKTTRLLQNKLIDVVLVIEGKNIIENGLKGNENYFELAGG